MESWGEGVCCKHGRTLILQSNNEHYRCEAVRRVVIAEGEKGASGIKFL
jgi:hypothetical protein